MSNYIESVTDSLKKIISDLSEDPQRFLIHPDSDFTRNRKIDFKTFVGITMNSGGCTMSKELLDFFDFNVNTPTASAYTQQRAKVLPDAFEHLFKTFTDKNAYGSRKSHSQLLTDSVKNRCVCGIYTRFSCPAPIRVRQVLPAGSRICYKSSMHVIRL